MWKFEFEAPVGTRVLKYGFMGVTHFERDPHRDLWWGEKQRKWLTTDEMEDDEYYSTHARCRSFKAFKRHLRKHPELNGFQVVLTSRYIGHNITARWIK